MLGELDRVLDESLSAGRSWRARLDESLELWPRLAESSAAGAGQVRGEVDFDLRGDGSALLAADLEVNVELTCQRCLETFVLAVPLEVRMALGEETGAPEGFEAYGQVGGVSVRQLLEDELLLEVPPFPVHPDRKRCGQAAEMIDRLAPRQESVEPRTNPFAALESLKTKK